MAKKVNSISRILNCIPSKETERDWRIKHSMNAGLLAAEPTVPESKDLRESWWAIGDQGTIHSDSTNLVTLLLVVAEELRTANDALLVWMSNITKVLIERTDPRNKITKMFLF